MASEQFPVVLHQGQTRSLPFQVLVMAPLQATCQLDTLIEPVMVSQQNFDHVMAQLAPCIDVLVIDPSLLALLKCPADALTLNFSLTKFEDFQPHRILASQSNIAAIHLLMENIHLELQKDKDSYSCEFFDCDVLHVPLLQQSSVSRQALELLVCELEHILSNLLDAVLHCREWQVVEAAWRGIHWLCQLKGRSSAIDIMLLPITREMIWDDLKHASSLQESTLYQIIYTDSMGQFGGTPYGCVMLDDYFSAQLKDINLLTPLLEICSLAQTPLITGVSPEMFSAAKFSHMQDHYSLPELFSTARYLKWRNFVASDAARYLSLVLPKIRFRERFSRKNGFLMWYRENTGSDADHSLWGNACYAMLANIIKRFMNSGFCTFISGDNGGVIDITLLGLRNDTLPVEVTIPEDKEAQLISIGLNPIITRPFQGLMLFPSANTVAWGNNVLNKGSLSGSVANAQLHYLFIVTRIIHCLKIVFRETLGATASRQDVSAKLNHWLKQYVSDVESPTASVMEKRPLRAGKVIVSSGEQHEWFDIEVELSPHLKFMGDTVDIATDVIMNAEGG